MWISNPLTHYCYLSNRYQIAGSLHQSVIETELTNLYLMVSYSPLITD